MNFTRELLLYLEEETSYVVGTDMFQGVFPDDIEDGFLFTQISGTENESNLKSITVHVTSMQEDYDTANDTINEIYDLLSYSRGLTLPNGTYVFNSVPMKFPSFITTTEHDKYVFTCSFTFYF